MDMATFDNHYFFSDSRDGFFEAVNDLINNNASYRAIDWESFCLLNIYS